MDRLRPTLIQITSATSSADSARDQAEHRKDLRAAGWATEVWTWTPTTTGQLVAAIESTPGRLAMSAPAVIVDLLVDDADAATPLLEAAWLTGATTLLRWSGLGSEGGRTTAPAAAATADVLITDADVAKQLAERGATRAQVADRWEAADSLALVGPLGPPETDLKLTVLVTTYNRPRELAACLTALTRQTLDSSRFDVVVVDDASHVDVRPIVASFDDRLHTTFVGLTENRGLGRARRAGLEASRGDVVLLLDDDDVAAPRVLAEHLRLHAGHPGDDVAVLGHTAVRPHDRSDVLSRHITHTGGEYFRYSEWRSGEVLDWPAFWGGRSSAKRSLMTRVPFRGAFMEDTDFAWRAEQDLRQRGSRLRVHYARQAVQVVRGPLDLAAIRRRQVRMGMAAWRFRADAGENMSDVLATAHRFLEARAGVSPDVLRTLDHQSATPLAAVVGGRAPTAAMSRLQRLDALLTIDLRAHHSVGVLAAAAADHLSATLMAPTLGIEADHPDLHAAVLSSHTGDQLRIVIRADPATFSAEDVTADLTAALAVAGRTADDVGDIEIRPVRCALADMPDIDFAIVEEGRASRSRPLPLLGLPPREWIAWLANQGGTGGPLR